jgi:hypothetical protein
MSFNKINRGDSAPPLLPNSAAPEAKASRPSGSWHASLFGRSLFPRAPKNSSTSMAPRDTTPLLSAEQRAAPSVAPVPGSRSGSKKPVSSLLSRAHRAVSGGLHQAGKAMSNAYQTLNEPNYTRLHSNYSQAEVAAASYYGVEPTSTPPETSQRQGVDARPASPPVATRLRPMTSGEAAAETQRADYHNERPTYHVEEVDVTALARARQQAAMASPPSAREPVIMRPMNAQEHAEESSRADYHHESPDYHDVVDHVAMAARRAQGQSQPRPPQAAAITPPGQDAGTPRPAAQGRKHQGLVPQRPLQARREAPLAENVRPPVNGQGGRPHGMGPTPGREARPMPSSRLPAPLGAHVGNVPRPAVHKQPAPGGGENVNPNISRPSQHAAVKKNLPSFAESFERGRVDRTFEPKQLVAAMVGLSKDTKFEQTVSQEIARNPEWGQQMQQRWNTLRNSVADARDDGNAQVPSLEYMIAKRPSAFIRFMGGGGEKNFARLMRPQQQAAPAHTPAAPEVSAQVQSPKPQRRDDMRPQAPRANQAQRLATNEIKPTDERTQLTAALRNLDQQIEASKQKGGQILRRIFDAPNGAAVAAATRESYAHKAQHNDLIETRNQVQARLQHVANGAVAGQPAGRPRADRVGQVQSHAPARASSAAESAANAELEKARATVAKGPPDLHEMYSTAIERVEHNNDITRNSTMIEPEDKHMEHVDSAAIEKKYDGELARYNDAKKMVDAAANPERAQAQAAAFKAAVRAEAHSMAERAYHADVREARDIVKQGPVSYSQVMDWARAEAKQNYTTVGSEHLDDTAIQRGHDNARERFEAARQLVNQPLTSEQTAAYIEAQMAEAERRVRQRHEGVGPGR